MRVSPWCPVLYQDFKILVDSRDLHQDVSTLPQIGYIAYLDQVPAAAGYLRMVEGGYAQIDSLISNKFLSSPIRHEALSMVVDSLIAKAKDLNLIGIISHTSDDGILDRAEKLGFKVSTQTIISLNLKARP